MIALVSLLALLTLWVYRLSNEVKSLSRSLDRERVAREDDVTELQDYMDRCGILPLRNRK